MVYRVDIGPERARGRNSVIEELWSATPDCREIVFKLEGPAFDEGFVRAASVKSEARLTAEAYLAEEVARNTRTGSGIVDPYDDRRGTVSHHHEIDELAYVFAGMLRVEVDRTRLGTNDRDSLDSGAGGESLGNHQRVCKAGAGLTQFHVWAGKADTVGDECDVGRHQASGTGRMTNKIGQIADFEMRFAQRRAQRGRRQIRVGMSRARSFVPRRKISAEVSCCNPESTSQSAPMP